ncbi:MAG: potassium-transporting ATPase subunit KdpC [Pirellulales bacterium]|nr:potassium-transporting ATPase subunit KdpC [Pirellulales bacterium]
MWRQCRPALVIFALLSLLTGVIYPAAVTLVAQLAMPHQANGSVLVDEQGRAVGSELIGQAFDAPQYFWGRLSATGPVPYNAGASSGSNWGPLNPALAEAARSRVEALRAAGHVPSVRIPVDLVTASGSGLDPHISPAAADYQVARVAHARGLPEAEVRAVVRQHTAMRTLGILGEPRVNVLLVNLHLDRLQRK